MKTLFSTLVIAIIQLISFGQYKLSGKLINNNDHEDSIVLNVPYVYGFHKRNNVYIPVQKDGSFNISINLPAAKFCKMEVGSLSHTLFLETGKDLKLDIDLKQSKIISFKGSGSLANQTLSYLELDAIPFFNKEDKIYSQLTSNGITDSVINPWKEQQDKKAMYIKQSNLPDNIKKLFLSELRYGTINQLSSYARGVVRMKRDDLIKFIISMNDSLSLDSPGENPGQQYYYFADNYVGYLEAKALQNYKEKKLSNTDPLDYYHISIDSGNVLSKGKGKAFLNWLAVKNNFPAATAEQWLAQEIMDAYDYKELKQVNALWQEMNAVFPQSSYLPNLTKYKQELEELLSRGETNKDIIVLTGYDKISKVGEIIDQYKGKVIYLDIWGTWCGPCKQELTFVPALKNKFKGKDVVFIYIDMDDDDKDKEWKDFIKVNNLSGTHLRKSNKDIQTFWEQLLPDQKDRHGFYPSYFIFDKAGKLAVPLSKRPSDKEELYKQLESFL